MGVTVGRRGMGALGLIGGRDGNHNAMQVAGPTDTGRGTVSSVRFDWSVWYLAGGLVGCMHGS